MATADPLLAAAQTVLANWEGGDLAAAMRDLQKAVDVAEADTANAVPVWYWDALCYNRDGGVEPQSDFQIEVGDKRKTGGQLFATIAPSDGNLDDMLPVTLEINRLPGSRDDVPCLHLHFDDSNLCVSFFKQGNRFIVRPETGVSLRNTILPNGEHAFIFE